MASFPSTRVTIGDIAVKLGLSRAAISLGLRNSPQIAAETCRRIQETAMQMGYQPNLSATNLAHCRHHPSENNVIAAFAWINSWKNPADLRSFRQFDAYWRSAARTAESAGFRLEEFIVDGTTNPARLQHILISRNIRGIAIPPQNRNGHWLRLTGNTFDWSRFSAVRIGHSVREPSVAIVSPDQIGNCILAVQKIAELGYRRIGFVALQDIKKTTQNWFLAGYFLAQIARSDSDHVPVLYLMERDTEDLQALDKWLHRHKPDAILTEYLDLPEMLNQLDVRVPGEIGLATLNTLDGKIEAGINQNPELVGQAAAEVLVALVNRNERGVSSNQRTTTVMGQWQDGPTLPPRRQEQSN